MRLSEYLLDRIFSLICMLVSALLLFGLLWLIETPATFILFAETILMAAYISALVYDFFRKRSYYAYGGGEWPLVRRSVAAVRPEWPP